MATRERSRESVYLEEICADCLTSLAVAYDAFPLLAYMSCGRIACCKSCAHSSAHTRPSHYLEGIEAAYRAWGVASRGERTE